MTSSLTRSVANRIHNWLDGRIKSASAGAIEPARRVMTDEQLHSWETYGYIHLQGAISEEDVTAANRAVDQEWAQRAGNDHAVDILTGPGAGRVVTLAEADLVIRDHAYKLNNLFGRRPAIRATALHSSVKAILDEAIGGEALICNSLNFERGSQQEYHIDSWYMPGPDEGPMIAASFALDDVDAENGPLTYYPGSHLIPPYRFSDGRINETIEEKPDCQAYLLNEIQQRRLVPVELHARRGDIFIWHGQLLHGGGAIKNFMRTRRSLVIHYWRREDIAETSVRVDRHGAYLGHTLRGEIDF